MSIEVNRRKTPYTRKEIKAILDDRKAHKEMTTTAWAKQYPISEPTYYVLRRKYQEGAKVITSARPHADTGKSTKPNKAQASGFAADLLQKLGRKYIENMTPIQLLEVIESLN